MPVIQVKVKPGARTSQLTLLSPGRFHADLRARPVDGKANAELITLVARHFNCPKSAVTIKTGAASRIKLVHLDHPIDRTNNSLPS
jgi:uncharacterized protein YggU (UPF0235/DUF167 family)